MSAGLYLCAILDWFCFGWCMLWPFGCWVLVFVEGSLCEARNVGIECAVFVVPLEFDSQEELSFPIDGYIIVLFQGGDEMVGVYVALVFGSKVIYNEGKSDWTPNVSP